MAKGGRHSLRTNRAERYYDRKIGNREARQTILIACEGRKTEWQYFRTLKGHLRLGSVTIKRGEGGNCCKTVQTACKHGGDYDQRWCVFDTEAPNNSAADCKSAVELARKNTIELAVSNPSFEYWLLLHFTYTDQPFQDAQEVIDELKKHLPEYQKDFDVHPAIQDHTQTAITHAQKVLENHISTKSGEFPNPSTHVHELVQKLYDLSSEITTAMKSG